MKHRVKSAALAFGLLSLAACSDTAGPEAFEDSLTLDVAMIAADAAIDAFGDMALLFADGAMVREFIYEPDSVVAEASTPAIVAVEGMLISFVDPACAPGGLVESGGRGE